MPYCVCFLAGFGLFLASASPTVSFEDTGELGWAAAHLGVTHPPGYPWLTMLGSLFIKFLPLGDPGFRLNVLSAACGAGSVTCAFALTRLLNRTGLVEAGFAALVLAVTKTFWWQSGIGDKYALSLFLMSLSVLALTRAWLKAGASGLPAAAFLSGLALSHHLHGLYLLPAGLLAAWRLKVTLRQALALAFLASLPLTAKAGIIAVRAYANPPLNWGVPDSLPALIHYLSARQYKFIMLASEGPGDIAARAVEQIAVTPVKEFGPVLALAVPGLAALRAAGTGLLPGAGVIFATNICLALSYRTPEIERYYLLSFFLLAVLIGLGLGRVLKRWPVWGLAALALAAVPFMSNRHTAPRTRHYLAYDFAVNQLGPLPSGSILICEGDDQAFPLFFLQGVLDYRPDVTVLPMPTACSRAGYEKLKPHLPDLKLPPFVENPGRHLPRIMLANPSRPAFYTPGCTGGESEAHLVPWGVVFRAFVDPGQTNAARKTPARLPRLRLRGVADAERLHDPVSIRAARNYAFGYAFRGAQALQRGQLEEALRLLRTATRMPALPGVTRMALTHLGMAHAKKGEEERAEKLYRRVLDNDPGFSPALLELGRLMLGRDPADPVAMRLLREAARNVKYLGREQREALHRLLIAWPGKRSR